MADVDSNLLERYREALVSLTALQYIEEHQLLDSAQLSDAKNSLQALFLRTSGAETMLRRLIEMLKVKRSMQSTFTSISGTIDAVRRSVEVTGERVDNLRRLIERSPMSPEAHAEFIGPFLSYAKRSLTKIVDFEQTINKYWIAREQESRTKTVFRIAQESSERLRKRISTSDLGQARGRVESRIKGELATSLNYAEAAKNMSAAEKQAREAEALVHAQLKHIYMLSQTAMEPSKRDHTVVVTPADELHTRFKGAQVRHPLVINRIKGPINDLLTLYQRAHEMFQADFEKLKKALKRLDDNSSAYFEAKAEDRDISAKREKLKKIEVLIQFLERAGQLMAENELDTEVKFSKALSEAISEPYASWKSASEELLPAKVRAEAEIARMF